jgi:hypothetical protein
MSRWTTGSSGCAVASSQAAKPKPARLTKPAIIRGLYDCSTREASVA